ncbi:MAG: hypothetical protein LC792_17015 [Actinobacteria bacterium]|nr:hypothetical protein [Actinomycetota bacterium]
MAIYVPRARRRRNTILIGLAALVVGAILGGVAGRSSAPTVEDRVGSVRKQAQAIASQLRVVSLHIRSGAVSLTGDGDAGADLALQRTETKLEALFKWAPWITSKTAAGLVGETATLRAEAPRQANSDAFGKQVDDLADKIEATFGAAG